MERINIITHKNCKIVVLDGKNLSEDELCNLIYQFNDVAVQNRINYFMLDVTGTHTTPKVRNIATECNKKATEQLGKIYTSLVGLSTLQRIIANAISRGQYFAANIEDAKNWLASKAMVDA
jgi:hypothetical protein